jgi:CRP-like cAMP-binding protein
MQAAQAIVQYADKITLAVLPEGSSFGELALCLATKSSASVVAHSALVQTLVIEGYYLNLLFLRNPRLEERFFRYLYAVIAYRLRVFKTDTDKDSSPTSTESGMLLWLSLLGALL